MLIKNVFTNGVFLIIIFKRCYCFFAPIAQCWSLRPVYGRSWVRFWSEEITNPCFWNVFSYNVDPIQIIISFSKEIQFWLNIDEEHNVYAWKCHFYATVAMETNTHTQFHVESAEHFWKKRNALSDSRPHPHAFV